MQSLSRLIFAFFLSIVFLFNTAVAYAIPQNIDSSFYDTSGAAAGAVIIKHKRFPDGSTTKEIIINPSTSGAAAGAGAGATVGTAVCTATVILAPSAPICAGVGALIGGGIGFLFGFSA